MNEESIRVAAETAAKRVFEDYETVPEFQVYYEKCFSATLLKLQMDDIDKLHVEMVDKKKAWGVQ